MGIRIHQLPASIANQIAAGEVIERPASIVKELLENSLDAQATNVTIEISHGGLNQVKISDNGIGIVAEDLPLALSAHATSKISSLEDLYAINSMGFRGEALASIASIARLTLISKPAEQDHAMMVQTLERGKLRYSPCARSLGTTVDVCDIFYNAPVRKRFLKNESLEFQAIEQVVKRFALSAPHIAITLYHNEKLIVSLPPVLNEQTQLKRLTKLFGATFVKESLYLDVERAGMRLLGWISGLNFQRSQNDKLWVYINKRMVKDKLIHHAIKQVYENKLHPGRFPACLLYLQIDSAEVDVNVHPTKHEVRFQQPRLIHDFFTSELSAALTIEPTPVQKATTILSEPMPYALVKEELLHSKQRMESCYWKQTAQTHTWIPLTQRHALIFIKQQPHVLDVWALYQQKIQEQLRLMPMPMPSRPLLVPVFVIINQPLNTSYLDSFKQLGMQMEALDEVRWKVLSIPVETPYLNIQGFINSVISQDKPNLEQILTLLSLSQQLDCRILSLEERQDLLDHLEQLYSENRHETFFAKALTEANCEKFFNE